MNGTSKQVKNTIKAEMPSIAKWKLIPIDGTQFRLTCCELSLLNTCKEGINVNKEITMAVLRELSWFFPLRSVNINPPSRGRKIITKNVRSNAFNIFF